MIVPVQDHLLGAMANYALTPPKQDHFISAEKGPPASGHRRLQQTTKPPVCVRVK